MLLFLLDCRALMDVRKTLVPEEVTIRRNSKANALMDYAQTKNCRWAFFLNEFNEAGGSTSTVCNNCDNCKNR